MTEATKNVFADLAEANIKLRAAQRKRDQVRARLEQELIVAAGGVKSFGPNIVDQERAFTTLLAASDEAIAADEALWAAEDAVERAKADVHHYECYIRPPMIGE